MPMKALKIHSNKCHVANLGNLIKSSKFGDAVTISGAQTLRPVRTF